MNVVHTLLSIAFVLALGVMSPGPNFALVTSAATTGSRRDGVQVALGFAAASATWTLAAVAGVGWILTHAGWVASAIRLAGAAYLVWLGLKMIAGARRPMAEAAVNAETGWAAVRRGFIGSMTNPKSLAFYMSIFSVMVPAGAPGWMDTAIVAIAAGVSFAWYGLVALLFSTTAVRTRFVRRKALVETGFGALLLAIGARMFAGEAGELLAPSRA